MRVLYVSTTGALGGAERVLLDLLAWQRRTCSHVDPHLLVLDRGPLADAASDLGVPTTVLQVPDSVARLGESGASTLQLAWRLLAAASDAGRFARVLRRHMASLSPDVVHANGSKAQVLAALAAPRTARQVWHVHDYLSSRPVTSLLLRRLARRCSLVMAVSASVATDVRKALAVPDRVVTVHNGVDVNAFREARPIDLDGLAGLAPAATGTVRVGLVATYARWKGQDVFLRALSQLPAGAPVRGYIIGGPIYRTAGSEVSRQRLNELARALNLDGRVGFIDFQADRPGVFHALDIVVHASTGPEPFGLTIAEAMAAGRPVITTGLGGAAEVVQDTRAIVTPAGDAGALASAIMRLAADAEERARQGECGREHVRRLFSLDRFGAAVEATHRAACSRNA